MSTSSDSNRSPLLAKASPALRYAVLLMCGSVFGAALQRGRVHEALTVMGQFAFFKHNVMLKMFISSAATSIFCLYLVEHVLRLSTTRASMTTQFSRGLPAVVLGAAIMGAGMALTGSCPGTVYAQLGAGSLNAWIILAGCFCGAGLMAVLQSKPEFVQMLGQHKLASAQTSLSSLFNMPRDKLSLVMAGALFSFAVLLEVLVPWKQDVVSIVGSGKGGVSGSGWSTANPAVASGIAIGLVQFALQAVLGSQLGSSGSYACVLAWALPGSSNPYLSRCRLGNIGQLLVMTGVVLGAFLSSLQTGAVYMSDAAMNPFKQFFGGVLLVFGAQTAGGCTSGHGMSGLGFQSTYSLAAVVSMFVSAIVTAALF